MTEPDTADDLVDAVKKAGDAMNYIQATFRVAEEPDDKTHNRRTDWHTFYNIFDWRLMLIPLALPAGVCSYWYPTAVISFKVREIRIFGLRIARWSFDTKVHSREDRQTQTKAWAYQKKEPEQAADQAPITEEVPAVATGPMAAVQEAQEAALGKPYPRCMNMTPPWFKGRWKDWHRSHGCELDDGNPRTAEGEAEIAAGPQSKE